MTNNYIKIEMTLMSSGKGGSYIAPASFKLDNIVAPFRDVPIKIDTGCSISTIPLARFRALEIFCGALKAADLADDVQYEISYGVESGGEKHRKPVGYDEKMACSALKFRHAVNNFAIANVPLDVNEIYINYNRRGNILIGMDILKNWDIHMGISRVTGTNLFLACPRGYENYEYFCALDHHFGLKA